MRALNVVRLGLIFSLQSKPVQWNRFMESDEPVYVDQDTVSCDGGGGPLGHPKVYLKFGSADENGDGEIVCPYCSARFILTAEAASTAGH